MAEKNYNKILDDIHTSCQSNRQVQCDRKYYDKNQKQKTNINKQVDHTTKRHNIMFRKNPDSR